MSGNVEQEVRRLLKRGLNHYGLGDLEMAISCWEKAQALDPENEAVRDYLATAYEESDVTPRSLDLMDVVAEPEPEPPTHAATESVDVEVQAALESFRNGELEQAWTRLSSVAASHPDRLDVRGYQELVRKQLIESLAAEVGDRGRQLTRVSTDQELMLLDLRPDEAYLLSQVDGMVTIDDLLSLVTLDKLRTFQILVRLVREGIVS